MIFHISAANDEQQTRVPVKAEDPSVDGYGSETVFKADIVACGMIASGALHRWLLAYILVSANETPPGDIMVALE